jgi:hypothetical protein
LFFAFARYGVNRNIHVAIDARHPHFVLQHQQMSIEDSSVSFSFAVNSGTAHFFFSYTVF